MLQVECWGFWDQDIHQPKLGILYLTFWRLLPFMTEVISLATVSHWFPA